MPADRIILTPNKTTNGLVRPIKAMFIHSTRSGQGPANWSDDLEEQATVNWLTNPASGASTTWVISGNGRKTRLVTDRDTSWHAKEHSPYAVSVELTQPLRNTPYTIQHYKSLVEIVVEFYPDIPRIHNTRWTNGEGGFTGHEESPQGIRDGKSDPGDPFGWNKFLRMLKEAETVTTDTQWLKAAEIMAYAARTYARRQSPSGALKRQLEFLIALLG